MNQCTSHTHSVQFYILYKLNYFIPNQPIICYEYNTTKPTKLLFWQHTLGRATDVSVAESTNKCHAPEAVQSHSAIHQVLHVDVPGFKASHGECSSHLSVPVASLLPDHCHPRRRACQWRNGLSFWRTLFGCVCMWADSVRTDRLYDCMSVLAHPNRENWYTNRVHVNVFCWLRSAYIHETKSEIAQPYWLLFCFTSSRKTTQKTPKQLGTVRECMWCACVRACFRWEGSWVFARRALVLVSMAVYLTGYSDYPTSLHEPLSPPLWKMSSANHWPSYMVGLSLDRLIICGTLVGCAFAHPFCACSHIKWSQVSEWNDSRTLPCVHRSRTWFGAAYQQSWWRAGYWGQRAVCRAGTVEALETPVPPARNEGWPDVAQAWSSSPPRRHAARTWGLPEQESHSLQFSPEK